MGLKPDGTLFWRAVDPEDAPAQPAAESAPAESR